MKKREVGCKKGGCCVLSTSTCGLENKVSHLSKVFGNVKNHYIINQNHIFSEDYYEVISGYILTNVTPKHSE
jgi:N-dimethylarginine dimethylaminohydrolase